MTTSYEIRRPTDEELDEIMRDYRDRMNDRDDPADIDRYWS